MSRLQELRQALGRAHDELIELTGDENAFTAKQHEISDLEGQIRRTNQAMQARAALGRPADPGAGAHNGNEASGERAKFASLGEQLVAVMRHYGGDGTDPRLVRAPTGAGETDASSGGFLVQTDFANTILTRAYEMGQILQRVTRLPLGDNAN